MIEVGGYPGNPINTEQSNAQQHKPTASLTTYQNKKKKTHTP